MTTLSYSVTEPALRSPVEEWQPHGKQSESTTSRMVVQKFFKDLGRVWVRGSTPLLPNCAATRK